MSMQSYIVQSYTQVISCMFIDAHILTPLAFDLSLAKSKHSGSKEKCKIHGKSEL